MARDVINRNGKVVTLLNPSEKGSKYAGELKRGIKQTNAGDFKRNSDGSLIVLNDAERAYRAGYLDAKKDSAKCYNATHGLKGKKKSRSSKLPGFLQNK